MKRREFITLLGCAAAWPLVARASEWMAMGRRLADAIDRMIGDAATHVAQIGFGIG